MKLKHRLIVALGLTISLLLSACAAPAVQDGAAAPDVAADAAPGEGRLTEVGTPRHETLIVDQLDGRIANPTQFNPYMAGTSFSAGFHQLVLTNMWEMNTVTGEQFPALAAEMPEPLNDDFTHFRIRMREGLYWSDGEPLNAEDVVFTIEMILNTSEFAYSGFLNTVIESAELIDDYTLEIRTLRSYPRLSRVLGVTVWGNAFRVVPKHIFENEDPATFQFFPPVSSGPYVLTESDPNGFWFLYEKRDDWERTDVGMLVGEPGPQYVLFRYYGTEELRTLAMIQHDLDVLQDITPESWDIIRERNEHARAWLEHFPYAAFDDPCERGMVLNGAVHPYDIWEVRWALALATDIENVALSTFAGMLRVSPIQVPPIFVLQETYHKPMVPWLTEFALPDGYQPFDPDYSLRMAERFRAEGIEGIPTDEQEIRDLFGVGWWRYDPDKAAELLESVGFSRGGDGRWLLPDGSPWEMNINAPAGFEVQSQRLAFAVADSWRQFGINANVQQMEGGSFWNSSSLGNFQVGSYWPGCGVGPDIYNNMEGWHQRYVVPVGELAPANAQRFSSDRISEILDEMAPLTTDDPRNVELGTELMKAFVEEMPWIQMFGTSKFVPVDTYYWEGFPTADNYYEGPWWWWSLFKYILPHVEPTGRQ